MNIPKLSGVLAASPAAVPSLILLPFFRASPRKHAILISIPEREYIHLLSVSGEYCQKCVLRWSCSMKDAGLRWINDPAESKGTFFQHGIFTAEEQFAVPGAYHQHPSRRHRYFL
jgi:hypothetical protein